MLQRRTLLQRFLHLATSLLISSSSAICQGLDTTCLPLSLQQACTFCSMVKSQNAAERWLTRLHEAPCWRVVASFLSKGSSYLIQTGTYGPPGAEVFAVPLWNAPLLSPQYAGYVNVPDTDKYIYYQLFVSQQSPLADPLIVG